MALLFDPNTLETVQLIESEERPAILCENFSWLFNNLDNFDPTHRLKDGWNQPGRGTRREIRANDSEKLSYDYFQHHKHNEYNPKIDPQGIIQITDFGTPINVEKFTVTADWPVKDIPKKEEYFGAGGRENPGGSYVCLVTARYDLQHHNKTRCYVHCSCKDFKYTFLSMLQPMKYTNQHDQIPSKGKQPESKNPRVKNKDGSTYEVPQNDGVCKHLFAILTKYYLDFILEEEGPDDNPELFTKVKPPPPPPPPPPGKLPQITEFLSEPARVVSKKDKKIKLSWQVKNATKIEIDQGVGDVSIRANIDIPSPKKSTKYKLTASNLYGSVSQILSVVVGAPLKKDEKAVAIAAIKAALKDADSVLPSNNLFSYNDPRKLNSSKNPPVRYHRYKFWVSVDKAGHAAIYYRNPEFATGNPATHTKVVNVPGFSLKNSYHLLSSKELHDLIKSETTPFSADLDKQLDKLREKKMVVMFYENIIELCDELRVLSEQSSILHSLFEFNFRNNNVSRS